MVISFVIDDGGIGSSESLSSSTAPVLKSCTYAHFATLSTGPRGVSPGVPTDTASFALPLGGCAANAPGASTDNDETKARRRESFMPQSPVTVPCSGRDPVANQPHRYRIKVGWVVAPDGREIVEYQERFATGSI